jgi:two-component system, NarL family, response regulator DesR
VTVIRILLVEDRDMIRGALVALLSLQDDLEVVAEVAYGEEILPAALEHRPDVAVIDIDPPRKDGLTAAVEIHRHVPQCRTLILTSAGRTGIVRRALAAHVGGFLLKNTPSDTLANGIRKVAAGRRVLDSQLAVSAWDSEQCPLTDREIEIVRLTAAGQDAVDIAGELFLSPGTVRNHLTSIIGKLDARNRVDAIRIAIEAEWL